MPLMTIKAVGALARGISSLTPQNNLLVLHRYIRYLLYRTTLSIILYFFVPYFDFQHITLARRAIRTFENISKVSEAYR